MPTRLLGKIQFLVLFLIIIQLNTGVNGVLYTHYCTVYTESVRKQCQERVIFGYHGRKPFFAPATPCSRKVAFLFEIV